MFLFILFMEIFFIPTFCLLHCIGGPNCHIKLRFNQIIPTNQELSSTCSIIQTSSCSVYLKIDYDNKVVNILFDEAPDPIKSLYVVTDLLGANPDASIILRYVVRVKIPNENKIELYVLIQCRTIDQCANQQLRHYYPQFISLNPRQNSFIVFFKLLSSNTSNVYRCFDDRTNQIEQCSSINNSCWASTNTTRQCIEYGDDKTNDFIYSYNKVNLPHRLTKEDVHYVLTCQANNCNNNETIHQLSTLARQFAENSCSLKNSTCQKRFPGKYQTENPSSSAMKLLGYYLDIFSIGFLLISKKF